MKNKLIMLVGISGCGKTSLAERLLKEREVDIIISSDAVRAELFGDENDQSHNTEVFNEVHKRIKLSLKEGKNVCFDATNLSCKRRMNFLKQLEDLDIEKDCIVVLTSFDDCVKRQSQRPRQVPEEVIRRQIKQFQCPYYYEGWDNIDLSYTSHVPLAWFMEQNKIPHDNPYHSLSIYEHMLKAEEVYRMNYYILWDRGLLEAVKYHDIGKYFCKEKSDDGIAHYYGHQNAGAYFYLLDVYNFQHNGLTDTLYTTMLIQWHMELMNRNDKGIENLEKILGEGIMRDLAIIRKCDETAH